MKDFKRHGFIWIGLFAAIILFGYLAASHFRVWFSLRKEVSNRQKTVEEFSLKVEELEKQIENVSDPSYLEKEARSTLNVKREGEVAFIVVGLENISTPENFSSVSRQAALLERHNPLWFNVKSWWEYFFGS